MAETCAALRRGGCIKDLFFQLNSQNVILWKELNAINVLKMATGTVFDGVSWKTNWKFEIFCPVYLEWEACFRY